MIVKNLCKSYGGRAILRDVGFEHSGGALCLMAPSGGGKTTLLRILLGLETADGGTVADAPERWAAVFQEDRLLERTDAMGNLRFALGAALDEAAAAALLKRLGLGNVGDKRAADYSGGMRRRLALCRCLLAPAEALALDEPFAGLDGAARAAALEEVRRAAEGKIVLLATHDPADAAALNAPVLRLG